jgi:hypothetical protein
MAELVRYPTDILEAVYDTHRYRLSDSNREILYAYPVCPGCRRGRSPFRP